MTRGDESGTIEAFCREPSKAAKKRRPHANSISLDIYCRRKQHDFALLC